MNMKTILQSMMTALMLLAALVSIHILTACQKDGPVEDAMENAGDTAEDVGESVDKAIGTDNQ